MFVQAARYMHNHNASAADLMKFRCYGVEKEPDTVKLAKMNLLLNNVRGDITEANSFYSDPYDAFGKFDYVMANPPFNVDEVVYERVKDDARFNTYGIPKNKSKTAKKDSDKKETVPNANYLWISYFASALNENGKAALVMANSASDAGNSEYDIRKKMIEEGIISQMVTLPSNMFSSVTLPATLWFFDKTKANTDKKDEILFIDARNVFTQIDRAHRKFSDEQIKNLGIISRLYEGNTEAFYALIEEYKATVLKLFEQYISSKVDFAKNVSALQTQINERCAEVFQDDGYIGEAPVEEYMGIKDFSHDKFKKSISELSSVAEQKDLLQQDTQELWEQLHFVERAIHHNLNDESKYQKEAYKYFDAHNEIKDISTEIIYYIDNILWLTERFPNGKYADVIGLCKVAKMDGEDGIIDQDYSLNAGRYVGVVIEDDGLTPEEFKTEMISLNSQLVTLTQKASLLEKVISENLKDLLEGI